MKSIGKAAEILRKAAAALRGKAGVLKARLLFLASLRRRAAVVAGISRHIRTLAPGKGQEKAAPRGRGMAHAPVDHAGVDDERATPAGLPDDDAVVGMGELASLFQEVDEDGDGGYTDWTLTLHSLFDGDDDGSHVGGDDEHRAGDLAVVEALDEEEDEPSVIDVIRSLREGDGREFRIEDEIDQAADMFITRVRRRMGAQPGLVVADFPLVSS